MLRRLKKLVTGKYSFFTIMDYFGLTDYLSDETYLKLAFKNRMGKKLNLDNPQTFNEKLQWLKLYDRKPEYTTYVDKIEARKYIAETIGEEYLIPCLGVWDSPEDIGFYKLPNQFVLKCNHNSGIGLCICKDKSKLDINKVKKELLKGLKENYYFNGREWPYKNVKPRIIAEKYMVDESGDELKDYKFMCFNGVVKFIQVMSERTNGKYYINCYDKLWRTFENKRVKCKPNKKEIKKPENLEIMVKLAEKLSSNKPFVRCDFYNINGKIYFGELTFFPGSGHLDFENIDDDYKLGSWIDLSNLKK